jgi:hypothetical protein
MAPVRRMSLFRFIVEPGGGFSIIRLVRANTCDANKGDVSLSEMHAFCFMKGE